MAEKKTPLVQIVEAAQRAGLSVSVTVSTSDVEGKEKPAATPAPAKQTTKQAAAPAAPAPQQGRGRQRSEESIKREQFIRALHAKVKGSWTVAQAAAQVSKSFDCTPGSAQSSVYALKDLTWKAAPRGRKAAAAQPEPETVPAAPPEEDDDLLSDLENIQPEGDEGEDGEEDLAGLETFNVV